MRKLMVILAMLTMTVVAKAQFEKDKYYVGASLSSLDLSYNGSKELSFAVQADGGYFIEDNWLVKGQVGYADAGKDAPAVFNVGAGVRYYIVQNGLFVGLNAKVLLSKGYNDFMPGMELGYAFFINDKLTIEPALYYDQSFKKHSDYSTFGLKVGLGVYF